MADLTLMLYGFQSVNAYIKYLFCWLCLALEFLILVIDAVVDRVVDAADGYAVIHAVFVDRQRQGALGHVQTRCDH